MKKLLCLLAALGLISVILTVAAADINNGYGPACNYDEHDDNRADSRSDNNGDDGSRLVD